MSGGTPAPPSPDGVPAPAPDALHDFLREPARFMRSRSGPDPFPRRSPYAIMAP